MDSTSNSKRHFEQAVVVLETEEDCKRCPRSMLCLAGRRLTDDVTTCSRCHAAHFSDDRGQYYVCTHLREIAEGSRMTRAAPEYLTCRKHFPSVPFFAFDCARMWNNYNNNKEASCH